MAQEVLIAGALFSDVPSIRVPDSNDTYHPFVDPSVTTATASDVASGKVFIASDGTQTTGTATSGGGSSSYTLVASTSYTVSTTKTTAATVATWATGNTSIWTSDQLVYVRIRDTAGPRAGYFLGSDTFFTNNLPAQGSSTTSFTVGAFGESYRYTSSSVYGLRYNSSTTGYGVYADYIYSDGRIRISSRYNSSFTLTIDGTYTVEAYLLDWPGGVSPYSA